MKKLTLIVALMILMTMPTFAKHVDPEVAKAVASTFLSNNNAKSDQITDISKEAGFENLYVFTTESSFVIMSADDCVNPILGYSLTGKFVAKDMPENVRGWLQGYNDEVQYAVESKMSATTEIVQLWEDLKNGKSNTATTTVVVDALVQTQWDQNGYYYYSGGQLLIFELYNNLCPYDYAAGERTVTGCVATAMAQIMKYWNFPSTGMGSHSYTPSNRPEFGEQFADYGATNYQWNNMPNSLNNNSTEVQKNAIATLLYHCGVAVDMMYDIADNGGSSASSSDIPYALYNYFGYKTSTYLEKSSYSDTQWLNMLKTELNANRPVEYNGRGSAGGHAFVCDGYDSNNYFHFNWGWSGANDGFFSLTNLNPGSGGAGGGGYNFTNNQSAIFGIQPTSNNAIPTNLTYTLSGLQNITLNWTGASGATSYNIYRNGQLVGNTTANTYSETAPFGTDVYYVRSLNSVGDLSLSSNSITVTIAYQQPVVDDLTATISGNNVSLSWTAPEWCYPEEPSATLNYGTGSVRYSWTSEYYGHRHLANDLAPYAGKAVYKISTYIRYPGTYSLYIYTGATAIQGYDNYFYTNDNNLAFSTEGVSVTSSNNWYDFELSTPIILTGTNDLWVIIRQENTGETYPSPSFDLSAHNVNAFYSGMIWNNNLYLSDCNANYNCAWLINTYVTDGVYTYNLYRNDAMIAQNLSSTTYNTQLSPNNANLFSVKTNYYGGETEASNRIGFAKGNATLTSLSLRDIDVMTVSSGNKLTVSGTLSNNNPASLILEDGAQLVHSSANVKATVTKTIAPYATNQNDGWKLIGSPVTEDFTPSVGNGLLGSSYDLYYYDEPTSCWMNYKPEPFNLEHKKGYLYANGQTGGTTLQFTGTLQPSNASVTVSNLSHSASTFNGFNLVANPFVCNATVNKDFYAMNDEGTEIMLAANGQQIAPCEGIFVVATNANASVTFTKSNAKKSGNSNLDITVAQDGNNLDRVRIHFDKANPMEKFNLKENSTKIYFPYADKDLAVIYSDGENEIPVNFKANKNGIYTIYLEAENLDLDYLHLIDNMTGEDIDLLATPSYTFEAKTTDYASRFKLVFSNDENAMSDNDAFAYFNDGNIVVNQEGILQIVDMAGRMIYQGDAMNRVSTNGMLSGVYVLRLVTADGVKTQKIVVE